MKEEFEDTFKNLSTKVSTPVNVVLIEGDHYNNTLKKKQKLRR